MDAAEVLEKFNAKADRGVMLGAPNPNALVKALAAAVLTDPELGPRVAERLGALLAGVE
jgi:hypothetical protein